MLSQADLDAFGIDPYNIEKTITSYKNWQPTYAAYAKWTDARKRQEQAVKEMLCEANEVLAEFVKTNRKGLPVRREKILDELGDTFWGLVGVMNEFNIDFFELAANNMQKLTERNKIIEAK